MQRGANAVSELASTYRLVAGGLLDETSIPEVDALRFDTVKLLETRGQKEWDMPVTFRSSNLNKQYSGQWNLYSREE